jgi:hypothetical protein
MNRIRPRIIHFHLPTSLLGVNPDLGSDIKTIADLHDLFFFKEEILKRTNSIPGFLSHFLDQMEFRFYDRVDGIIVTSKSMKSRIGST